MPAQTTLIYNEIKIALNDVAKRNLDAIGMKKILSPNFEIDPDYPNDVIGINRYIEEMVKEFQDMNSSDEEHVKAKIIELLTKFTLAAEPAIDAFKADKNYKRIQESIANLQKEYLCLKIGTGALLGVALILAAILITVCALHFYALPIGLLAGALIPLVLLGAVATGAYASLVSGHIQHGENMKENIDTKIGFFNERITLIKNELGVVSDPQPASTPAFE